MMILTKLKRASNCLTTTTQKLQKAVLAGCGGKENITSIDNCITRLRLEVKDTTKSKRKSNQSDWSGWCDSPRQKTSVQVIIGTQVQFVADEFKKLCK